MERKILYLINPVSGTGDKKKLEVLISAVTEKSRLPFTIQSTESDGDYAWLEERIINERFTDVGICGGDGTVNAVIPKLNHLNVRFGVIPAGSGNGLAFSAGIPASTTKALEMLMRGKTRKVDAFQVNDAFACMLSGLGFDAEVAHHFAAEKNRGLGKYAWLTARTFFQAKPYEFRLKANGKDVATEAFFICVANSNQFGNHITIAPRADLSDGLLDVIVVRKQYKPLLLLRMLRHLLSGKVKDIGEARHEPVIYFQTNQLEIENLDNAPLHIDGEARSHALHMKYNVLPRYFELIC
jgi:YegS/Rv2252/BmrU family lipid kinase